jgi:hypothetical protein
MQVTGKGQNVKMLFCPHASTSAAAGITVYAALSLGKKEPDWYRVTHFWKKSKGSWEKAESSKAASEAEWLSILVNPADKSSQQEVKRQEALKFTDSSVVEIDGKKLPVARADVLGKILTSQLPTTMVTLGGGIAHYERGRFGSIIYKIYNADVAPEVHVVLKGSPAWYKVAHVLLTSTNSWEKVENAPGSSQWSRVTILHNGQQKQYRMTQVEHVKTTAVQCKPEDLDLFMKKKPAVSSSFVTSSTEAMNVLQHEGLEHPQYEQ